MIGTTSALSRKPKVSKAEFLVFKAAITCGYEHTGANYNIRGI